MVQRDWWYLGSAGTQGRSLAWYSGLRIWHCCSCGLGRDCGLELILSLGTPYAMGRPKMTNSNNNNNNNKTNVEVFCLVILRV